MIGVDVGGTFTDVVAWDAAAKRLWLEKVPTTPDDPSRGTLQGIHRVLATSDIAAGAVEAVRHGTTIATNALIQRTGARTGLITTKGFRDVLEIARCKRDVIYDLLWVRATPIVRRRHRREVRERALAAGNVMTPLDLSEIEREFRFLRSEGVESIAISFLHAYAQPEHESRAAEHLRSLDGSVPISTGHEVLPVLGEYERTNLAVTNAYLLPLISVYLDNMRRELGRLGLASQLSVMQSNGGAMDVEQARSAPVRLILSGPAAGVTGAAHLARQRGFENLVTFDMGGTSCDVCLVEDGTAQLTATAQIAGHSLALLPTLYINTIGAGGGSIARVDAAGALKVGPESAGSVPGPASYGNGGTEPTVTDAWLVVGLLDPARKLAGTLQLDKGLAEAAISTMAESAGLRPEEAAAGVLRVVEANMVQAVKAVSVKKGRDPKSLVLVAYGGAGPLAAAGVARELGMRRVLVPRHPGLVCALGTLVADVRYDLKRSFRARVEPETYPRLISLLATIERELSARFRDSPGEVVLRREADVRYAGQFFTLPIQIPNDLSSDGFQSLRPLFDGAFRGEFGHDRPDQPVEFDSVRVVASQAPKTYPVFSHSVVPEKSASSSKRTVFIDGAAVECNVREWASVSSGEELSGPMIVEEFDSTVWVPPGARASVADDGSILLEV